MRTTTHYYLVFSFSFVVACGCFQQETATKETRKNLSLSDEGDQPSSLESEISTTSTVVQPLQPVIKLPELEQWTASALRPLPQRDFGFSVAYDHETDFAVTLYHYTRGYEQIPNGVGRIVANEMTGANDAIQQAVEYGVWDSAKIVGNGEKGLGDSNHTALWSCHILTTGGRKVRSHTFVWAYNNRIFKIRATGHELDSESEGMALNEFLTEIGNACKD